MKITVFGMGKIGLPLAVQFARKGHEVTGVDRSSEVVSEVNSGIEPFPGEEHLASYLAECVDAGLLHATTDASSAVQSADAVVVAVPLYVDAEAHPDFSAIDDVTAVIGDSVQSGTLVSFETTLPIGTTRDRIGAEIGRRSGLRVGRDVHLVFSPERVLTGRVFADLRKYPKLVGGISDESERRGVDFYSRVLDFDDRSDLSRPNGVWAMGGSETAEMAKLAETTYRDVNIGLANQFALFAERNGIDVTAVIEACNSQPYSHIHSPGIAVGGHCIPVYPRLYLWTDPEASIVRAAREANAGMPERVVRRLEQEMGAVSGLSVAVLGAAYRGGVKETAFSGVFDVVSALEALGAQPQVHDPLYSDEELMNLGFEPYARGQPVDALILHTDHQEYQRWALRDCPGIKVIVDGRGTLNPVNWEPDCRYLRIGT